MKLFCFLLALSQSISFFQCLKITTKNEVIAYSSHSHSLYIDSFQEFFSCRFVKNFFVNNKMSNIVCLFRKTKRLCLQHIDFKPSISSQPLALQRMFATYRLRHTDSKPASFSILQNRFSALLAKTHEAD